MDLYYISSVFSFDCTAVLENLKNSNITLGSFSGFLNRKEELLHSYEKFRLSGTANKPPFDEVYKVVKTYLADILPK